MTPLTPFASAATDLVALGYSPIPLISASADHPAAGKAPGDWRSGAWHGLGKWQRYMSNAPDSFTLRLWLSAPEANVGIVLGTKAGTAPDGTPLHLIAVDLDAEDADALDTLMRACPTSPMVKRGLKGETRFYRAPATIKSKPYDGPHGRLLDLLTGFDPRQTVMPPSIHPKTGKPYAYVQGPVRAEDLPLFGADDLEALEEALETCGWERGGKQRAETPLASAPPAPDSSCPFEIAKAAAMSDLSAWVPALDLYGLRRARGGYEAVEAWRSSTTGRPLEQRKRNLSIQPNGIRDFGSNNTYSALDLVMAARDCSQADALAWLEDRLGLGVPDDVVIDLRPRVVDRPLASTPVVDHERPVGDPQPATHPAELPDALTRVPGLVGDITEWISDSARRPQRGLAVLAALCLVGTAAGRRYAGPTMTGTHLYALGLAGTSAGKDHALKAIARVLNASTMGAHLGPSQFMSMSALIKRMTRQPLTLSCIDEFGSFLARINGRKASTHERAITGVLRTAWGSSFDTMAPPEWAGQVGEPIHSPALSLYGVSTAEEFFAALEGGDVFNGFLNRFLIVSTRSRPAEREPTADKMVVPPSIVDRMLAIYQAGSPLSRATAHMGMADKPDVIVPWADRFAHMRYMAFAETVERRETDVAFLARSVEMAQRLAVIRAIGMNPTAPKVTLEDMDWGCEFAEWSAAETATMARDYMSETQHQGEAQRVVRVCRRQEWKAYREIARALNNRMRAKDLRELLDGLVDSGALEMQETRPESGGHKIKSYRLAA